MHTSTGPIGPSSTTGSGRGKCERRNVPAIGYGWISEVNKPSQLVYLVRHGETAWSLSGQHTGITDIPLTANGRRVAKLFAPLCAKLTLTLVLTSPLERARTTCEL